MIVRLLLTAMLAATLAFAQGKKGGSRNGGMDDEMSTVRLEPQSRFDVFADKLKLSKEQKEEARNVLSAAMEESAPVRTELNKTRVAIATVMIDGKGPDELKKLMDEYASEAAQMTGFETKAFAKLYGTLKPNQQSKAGQAFELLAEMLDRPAAGGGRNGGSGGRRGSR
ncbi:MAG TPA: hypothetical protein VGH38_00465 [Bryobacteraceae bacterium]